VPKRSDFKTYEEWIEHLRFWFAGQALVGMIASSPLCDRTDPKQVNKPKWARQAYDFADAMLAARKESPDGK
jgi:hypothetical protein